LSVCADSGVSSCHLRLLFVRSFVCWLQFIAWGAYWLLVVLIDCGCSWSLLLGVVCLCCCCLVGCCFVVLIWGFSCVDVSCFWLAVLELVLSPWRLAGWCCFCCCCVVAVCLFGCCWLIVVAAVAGGWCYLLWTTIQSSFPN
jgi:hypothetical protein